MSRILATAAAAALVLASCGADDDASSVTTPSTTPGVDLRPPVAVAVDAVGTGSGATEATADGRISLDAASAADDAEPSIMPWFGGFVFEAGDGLPPLPANDVGYEFPGTADIDAEVVADLAAALGVEGEVTRGGGRDGDGMLWRVGPDDGSAATVAVFDDGQLSWYFSPPWPELPEPATEPAVEPGVEPTVEPGAEPTVEPGDDAEIQDPPTTTPLTEPEPPVGVPDEAAAEQRARELLAALGQDADAYELETYADEWFASVNAWPLRDGVRWPMTWGFGFGENAELQWAGGSLAEPVPAGPYPLIDLDTAIERLNEQGAAWGGIALPATSETIRDADPGEPRLDTDDAPDASVASGTVVDGDTPVSDDVLVDPPVNGGAAETPEPELAVLVDVRPDLWWVWDADGSVWLLPAYAFTDTEGRVHTVPAVTDEFVTFVDPPEPEPGLVDPMPTEPVDPVVVDPVPGEGDTTDGGDSTGGGETGETGDVEPSEPSEPVDPVEPIDLEDLDRDALVGATVQQATELLEADGNLLRVIRLDGEDLAATMDFRPNRVNVAVEDDIVVELISVG